MKFKFIKIIDHPTENKDQKYLENNEPIEPDRCQEFIEFNAAIFQDQKSTDNIAKKEKTECKCDEKYIFCPDLFFHLVQHI